MMKRKSFLLIIISFFWIGYMLLSIGQTIYGTKEVKKVVVTENIKQIDHLLSIAQTLVMMGNLDALKSHMDEAVALKTINFYCIKDKDSVLFEHSINSKTGCAMTYDRRIASFGDPLEYQDQIVMPIKIQDHYVSVGFAVDFWDLFWEGYKINLSSFIKDVIIITSFLGVLVYLIMKDILMLDQLLQKGSRSDLSKIRARSKEAQTLIDSTQALNKMNDDKSEKIHHLQNTVGLAIHSEIYKKTAHLTRIQASVVRIDLNGYTQIFLEKKEEHIVSVLNEYFSVTNDIISRFNGEIYQIIGDEIIFILKNQDHRSALFCVRAIFDWAVELDRKIFQDFKHRFLLKASISHGPLRFVQLNNGYAFAGVPLIESVRLLGCVSDKSENTLIIKKEGTESVASFFRNPSTKQVDLKGIDGQSEILEIKDFFSLAEFFQTGATQSDEILRKISMESLKYFRGQKDIQTSLQLLERSLTEQKWSESFYLVHHLKDLKLGIKNAQISAKLFQILSDHFQTITVQSRDYPFLNSMVLMVQSLVHPDLWSEPWGNLLKNYLLCSNSRIVANATEVLCNFGFDWNQMQAILLNWKDNNRISANFLLPKMKISIDKVNTKTLLSWLDSDNVLFQASALYVIEETIKHYSATDLVVVKTNGLLADCILACNKLKNSPNELVKSRYEKLQIAINISNTTLPSTALSA